MSTAKKAKPAARAEKIRQALAPGVKAGKAAVEASGPPRAHRWRKATNFLTRKEATALWACEGCGAGYVQQGPAFTPPAASCRPGKGAPDPRVKGRRLPVVRFDAEGRVLKANGTVKRLWIVDTLVDPARAKAPDTGPFVDNQGRLVVLVKRAPAGALFIQRQGSNYKLEQLPLDKFDDLYHLLKDDPDAVDRYLKPIAEVGAPADVLLYVGKVSSITEDVLKQAAEAQTRKFQEFKERIEMAKKAKQSAKGSNGHKKPAVKKAPGEKRETASALFQELIMAGGKTDDQIFAQVKAKFGLDDKKRSYVAWYRNHLRKAGQKPPEPKEAKSA